MSHCQWRRATGAALAVNSYNTKSLQIGQGENLFAYAPALSRESSRQSTRRKEGESGVAPDPHGV